MVMRDLRCGSRYLSQVGMRTDPSYGLITVLLSGGRLGIGRLLVIASLGARSGQDFLLHESSVKV